MVIKNTGSLPVEIRMATRVILLRPGEMRQVTAEEVLDSKLRELLQVRAVSIVRPTTDEEEAALLKRLFDEARKGQRTSVAG